ncbi:ACP phosphodiesterase [Halomonas sp. A020]|uniref:acyl carrier protein phosphodiesterase n=1 Tax=Halomonas sp. A020 TaxID=2717374 RepID=UPI0024900EB9|nr:ACP phosphodiesterase [Halomonas sp. A020]BCB61746.1 ACP phosphodiesterase [Halomonas sp. A020]
MNFLAHAWLAQPGDDGFLYGNLIADGVKGSDLSGWSPSVAGGIRHHRRVDAWVDQHPSVLLAKRRAPKTQRRYAGIALDIVWDHFIARQHAGAEQSALVERCYRLLSAWPAPQRLSTMMPVLVEQDWLRRYADFDFTCRAVSGIGQRLSGANRLAELVPWLREDYAALERDFSRLWSECRAELTSDGAESIH